MVGNRPGMQQDLVSSPICVSKFWVTGRVSPPHSFIESESLKKHCSKNNLTKMIEAIHFSWSCRHFQSFADTSKATNSSELLSSLICGGQILEVGFYGQRDGIYSFSSKCSTATNLHSYLQCRGLPGSHMRASHVEANFDFCQC